MRRLESGTHPELRLARPSGPVIPPRQRALSRLAALKTERTSWIEHWRDLAVHIQPRKSRFLASERNRGEKKHHDIINGTATWGARVLSSGMMAGITSPARPWFRLTTPDPDLAEYGAVKEWLHLVEERIRQSFARSNIYNHLHQAYESLAVFGTAAMLVEDDPEDILRAYSFPIGSYCLANSARLRVDTLYRDQCSMTVAQVVEQFGLESVSRQVRADYERGTYDRWVEIIHYIEPNREQQHGRLGAEGMAWRSCWMEAGGPDVQAPGSGDGFLRRAGYEEFPVLAPRWGVTGEDVYGHAPAMDVLGDIKALQQYERRKAQAIDKVVNPPMKGPGHLQHGNGLPGSYTAVDAVNPTQTYEPAMVMDPRAIAESRAAIAEHEARIKTGFYADLWLMLAQGGGDGASKMTAREVAERHEEKMLQLGPVMERLQDELLDPLVDRCFNILLRNGDLPPPPDELAGMDLRVEYLSIMAQAQKMLGITGVERLIGFATSMAQFHPEALDKVDFDQALDEYGLMLGVPPALVRTDEDVDKIRAARAQATAEAQASEQQEKAVAAAKTLSETDPEGGALKQMLAGLGAPPPPVAQA